MPIRISCPYLDADDSDDVCEERLLVYGTKGTIEDVEGDCPHVEDFYDGTLDLALLEAACDEAARERAHRD